MNKLASLDISSTRTGGDRTLDTLRRLGSLRSLKAAGTKIDDHGLSTISAFRRLYLLDVSRTAVSDAGVKSLAGHESLRTLNVSNTLVGDTGAKALVECPELVNLHLGNTRITDDALIRFRSHFLIFLDVSGTAATSKGIIALIDQPVPDVSAIDITNTKITLPRNFKPAVRESDRMILKSPFHAEAEEFGTTAAKFTPQRNSSQ